MIICGKVMEPLNQKSLERVVSQRALQMGSSFPCQICVVGFLCGVCLTSVFLATLTSFGTFGIGGISFTGISSWNSNSETINMVKSGGCNFKPKEIERKLDSQKSVKLRVDDRVSLLYSAWSALLNESINGEGEFLRRVGLHRSNVPKAPHMENCKLSAQVNERLDNSVENESLPPWTIWKGLLDIFPFSGNDEQLRYYWHEAISEGAYPPWITGSDEENFPLTRKVQRDLWIHQHPVNCSHSSVRFLVADWERLPGFGIGAQLAGMCGLLAIAINEKRVLVTNYYNRADHDGCKGSSRSSWSCYFFPETSQECRDRAFELMGRKEAWEQGIITGKDNYSSKEIWAGRIPRVWGNPWSYLQPTTEINGSLVAYHRKMDIRWWRAQALRYLMRFQTVYTCSLLNAARHAAFGWEAAKMVLATSDEEWTEDVTRKPRSEIEEFVWSNHKPWIPKPLLSMHVRMGDKACEMKVVQFEEYMRLAERIRKRFPHLNSIWLSTEMQEVIDKSRSYPHWKFYYTKVKRQEGNRTMATYEASLGRETSTNYPLVNFLMATEADFFIGALGSTWCFLIDGMRNTGGKVMAGYLSVNKDRFW
uniref:Alpha-(1,6)-fucosyltransferase n=2 Tax=Davidia involucrata TaxID=16924 RepID=A0A5B6YZ39_DAVIN